jgi:hypothetical protein
VPPGRTKNGKPIADNGVAGIGVILKALNHGMFANQSKEAVMLFDRLFAILVVVSVLFSGALIGVVLIAL